MRIGTQYSNIIKKTSAQEFTSIMRDSHLAEKIKISTTFATKPDSKNRYASVSL